MFTELQPTASASAPPMSSVMVELPSPPDSDEVELDSALVPFVSELPSGSRVVAAG